MQGEALRNIAREGYNNGTTQGKGKGTAPEKRLGSIMIY